jgi:Zn ribbon nucleic-acid-binding protein
MTEVAAGAPCPLCEVPLEEKTLPEFSGDEAPLRLTIRHFPALACPAPHRYFIGHEFPVWLLNALVEAELARIPKGKEQGRVFRKCVCGGCGAALRAAGAEWHTFSSTLAWRETRPFVVDLTVPVVECPSCGMAQARSGAKLAKLVPSALVHAFKAAGLKSPG